MSSQTKFIGQQYSYIRCYKRPAKSKGYHNQYSKAVLSCPWSAQSKARQCLVSAQKGQTNHYLNQNTKQKVVSCFLSLLLVSGLNIGELPALAETQPPATSQEASEIDELQSQAIEAYSQEQFDKAIALLTQLINREPFNPELLEGRAQVLIDAKQFPAAIADYNKALSLTPQKFASDISRYTSGRALAYEGLSNWTQALEDYKRAEQLARDKGFLPDPYLLNSIGNVLNSLERWTEAREYYLASGEGFREQLASIQKIDSGLQSQKLYGLVYANTNAALMAAQLGQDDVAIKELIVAGRKGPGSVDAKAGLAALFYRKGYLEKAESSWDYACAKVSVGCSKYSDKEWLRVVRRWPPVMINYLTKFLTVT